MRKHLIWVLGVAVAAGSVFAASFAVGAANTQFIEGSIKPKKLPRKERKPISLDVNVFSTHPSGSDTNADLPHPTSKALVDFDKDLHFQQKGYPTCDPGQFGAASTTADVKEECGDAAIGSGNATVKVPTGPATPPITVDAQVAAANVKGNKVLLHSYNSLSGGQPLVGQLKKTSGKYGTTLDVDVPPLAGGTAVLTQFRTIIDKVAYRHKGKKLAIVSSSCRDKKIKFRARFTDDVGQTATGTDVQKCKRKG